jgi:hypothetical protein
MRRLRSAGALAAALLLPGLPAMAGAVLSVDVPVPAPQIGSLCSNNGSITLTVRNTGDDRSPFLDPSIGLTLMGDAFGAAAIPAIDAGGFSTITVPLVLQGPPPPVPDPGAATAYPVLMNLTATLDLAHRTTPVSPSTALQAIASHCPLAPLPGSGTGLGSNGRGGRALAVRPADLHPTSDVTECQTHGGNFFCAALKGGAPNLLVLVWSGTASAQAYTLYRTDAGRHLAVATGSQPVNGSVPTAQGVENVVPGSCYAVSMVRPGAGESELSDPYCVGNNVPAKEVVVTLPALRYRSVVISQSQGRSDGSRTDHPQAVLVGYTHIAEAGGVFGDSARSSFARAGLFFDVGFLANHHVSFANLKMRVDYSNLSFVHNSPPPYRDSVTQCAARAGVGTSPWWNGPPDMGVGEPSVAIGRQQRAAGYDVSDIARAWAAGAPNYGIVLVGSDENLEAFTETGCYTQMIVGGAAGPTLTVSYH